MSFYFSYIGLNPYRISRQYWEEDVYGETPLAVYKLMAKFTISKQIWVELGAGRGEGIIYLNQYHALQTVGVEKIDFFVNYGAHLLKKMGINQVVFEKRDLKKDPLPPGDVYYLAGTCMDDEVIQHVTNELEKIRPYRVFSLSEALPLQGYSSKLERVEMPFGKTVMAIMTREDENGSLQSSPDNESAIF